MTGKTHKAGGALCALISLQLLKSNNLLIDNLNPLVQCLVIYPFALWGSTAPDLDHDESNLEDRNPVNLGINKVLHIPNNILSAYEKVIKVTPIKNSRVKKSLLNKLSCKHRSWQTHSDITLILMSLLLYVMIYKADSLTMFNTQDIKILMLCLTGIFIGFLAHLILDMLTTEGIKSLIFTLFRNTVYKIIGIKKKRKFVRLGLVPETEKFSVSNENYELTVRKILIVTTNTYFVILLSVYIIGEDKILNLINYCINKISSIF